MNVVGHDAESFQIILPPVEVVKTVSNYSRHTRIAQPKWAGPSCIQCPIPPAKEAALFFVGTTAAFLRVRDSFERPVYAFTFFKQPLQNLGGD